MLPFHGNISTFYGKRALIRNENNYNAENVSIIPFIHQHHHRLPHFVRHAFAPFHHVPRDIFKYFKNKKIIIY
jgi:hypothetical protein